MYAGLTCKAVYEDPPREDRVRIISAEQKYKIFICLYKVGMEMPSIVW